LWQLAAEGRLTPQVIIKAFQEARGELQDKFAKTIPTIGQSFQILSDQVSRFFGELGRNSGITDGFSNIIILIANNLKLLSDALVTVAVAYLLRFVPAIYAGTIAMWGQVGAFLALTAEVRTFSAALTLAQAATVGWVGVLG